MLLAALRPKERKKKEREPFAQFLVDTMKIIFIISISFGFILIIVYTVLNFWDVIIRFTEFVDYVASKFGLTFIIFPL